MTSEVFPYLGIRHVGVPPRVRIYANVSLALHAFAFSFKNSMDLLQEESKESVDDLCGSIPVLSEYAKSLDQHVKRRYLEKIAVLGIDPETIPSEQFSPECLPPIEATDLLSYLVLETSYYTKQQFKAYKSLEAYNQMVSGFITCVQGCVVSGKHVVVAKVRHSQRMNDPPISIWIVADKDGTIVSAHCLGCKAGLAESCSHVASVLFYIEAWTRIHGKLACTQVKCTWLLPTYVTEVPYARVRDINFKSARKLKAELDTKIDSIGEKLAGVSDSFIKEGKNLVSNQIPTDREMRTFYERLNNCNIKPVALSLREPYSEQFVSQSRTIPTIPDLFNPENLQLAYHDLLKKCLEVTIQLSADEMAQIEKDTRTQAKGAGFFRHRAGRIGASVSGAVSRTNPVQPSQTLIKSICYPHLFKVKSKAVIHGCKHEADAIRAYENQMKNDHVDFKITTCGILINQEHPFIHATPDFLTSCACCGLGCGEVKCPFCIEQCDFDSYVLKKSSCLEKVDGMFRLKRSHNYFFQVQQQLFTATQRKYCDFIVYAFDSCQAVLVKERIYPEPHHWQVVLPKLTTFWRTCILPEILGRWYSRKCTLPDGMQHTSNGICFCRMPPDGNGIKCSNPGCPFIQFHPSCLAITTPLPSTWFCPHCRRLPQFKRSKAKQNRHSPALNEALTRDSVCVCQATPHPSDRLLECHSVDCNSGKFFHLNCLGFKRMPNNSKTTWICNNCKSKRKKAPPGRSNDSTTPPASASQPLSAPLCQPLISLSADRIETHTSDAANDSSSESGDDLEITKVTVCEPDRRSSLGNLVEQDYQLILSPAGWLDCSIIHHAQVLLHDVNPLIEGLQHPTLGPVRNFSVVSGEFVQILHTGRDHWVCVSSIGCLPGLVNLYDSLYHDVIGQEVEDQVRNLLSESFEGVDYVPVQQQTNGSDCGVFAVAFATCLVFGTNPQDVTFDIARMRPHLFACFWAESISLFPTF